MTASTPRLQRLARIETKRAEAERLMTAASHDNMKAHIRRAVRNLDEAILWLKETDVDHKPPILLIVDSEIDLATQQMALVAKAITDYGPDTKEIG
jgi:hypothetical protein